MEQKRMSFSAASDDDMGNRGRNDTYLQYLQAKKTMDVKKEAEKFRVGSKVRLMERDVLILQGYIASISMISIVLAVFVQEISCYGVYSNALGGEWFLEIQETSIPASELIVTADTKTVIMMKFILTKLTIIQLFTMIAQFKVVTSIMIEQKQLDLNLQETMDSEDTPVVSLTGSFGYSSSYLLLLKYCVELAVCAVHPLPFIKKKFITTIVGREAIYNVESLVNT